MTDHESVPTRIIIADDHPLFRSALARLLEEGSGLEVVAQAADGREALEFCRRFGPDLVIMDLSMPNMDGLQATRALIWFATAGPSHTPGRGARRVSWGAGRSC